MSEYLKDGSYVVVPDLQIPYHDEPVVDAVINFIREFQPAGLLNVGDEADQPEPSRWNKGSAGEFAGTLEQGLNRTFEIMSEFDDALRAGRRGAKNLPHHVMRSNHTDRISIYLNKYAPALASMANLSWPALMGYRQPSTLYTHFNKTQNITYHDDLWEFSPGWVLAHGDEGGNSRVPGGTAMGLARRIGASVVCGHTHKLGMQHENVGFSGKFTNYLYGVEVGNLMKLEAAGYLTYGAANWQQGFVVLDIYKGIVTPNVVMIRDRGFSYQGQHFEIKGRAA